MNRCEKFILITITRYIFTYYYGDMFQDNLGNIAATLADANARCAARNAESCLIIIKDNVAKSRNLRLPL